MTQNDVNYVYVITRRDLSPEQQSVQCGHALIEATKSFEDPQNRHPHLVYCSVRNEQRLERACAHLDKHGIRYATFYEPDKNNELTAIATEHLIGKRRCPMRQFQIIKYKELSNV